MASLSAFEMSTSLLCLSVLFFPPSFGFLCDFIGALRTDRERDIKTGLDDRKRARQRVILLPVQMVL